MDLGKGQLRLSKYFAIILGELEFLAYLCTTSIDHDSCYVCTLNPTVTLFR